MFDVCCKKIKTSTAKKNWGIYSVIFYKDKEVSKKDGNTGNFKKEIIAITVASTYIPALFKPTTWENGVEYQDRPKINIKVQEIFLEAHGINFNKQSENIYFDVHFGGSLGTIRVQKGKFQFVGREGSIAEWSGMVKNDLK